ncbi:MAG: hypothetical protein SNH79_05970 [Rikenellaceae bacterium]
MNRWFYILICVALTICGLGSCVNEDLSDCPSCMFALYGISDEADAALAFNGGEIFIFDSEGYYVETVDVSAQTSYETLSQGSRVNLYTDLDSDDYTAIIWAYSASTTSDGKSYVTSPEVLVPGVTLMSDITINGVYLDSETRSDSTTTTGPARDIWTGEYTFTHKKGDRKVHDMTVRQQTKTIDVTSTFILPDDATRALADGNTVEIMCYDSDLSIQGASVTEKIYYSYVPFAEELVDDQTTISNYRKMSLHKSSTQPVLVVKAEDKVIYQEFLFTILAGTNYANQTAIDKESHFNIDLSVVVDNVAVTIWVNGWRYVPVNGGVKFQ